MSLVSGSILVLLCSSLHVSVELEMAAVGDI